MPLSQSMFLIPSYPIPQLITSYLGNSPLHPLAKPPSPCPAINSSSPHHYPGAQSSRLVAPCNATTFYNHVDQVSLKANSWFHLAPTSSFLQITSQPHNLAPRHHCIIYMPQTPLSQKMKTTAVILSRGAILVDSVALLLLSMHIPS